MCIRGIIRNSILNKKARITNSDYQAFNWDTQLGLWGNSLYIIKYEKYRTLLSLINYFLNITI